MMESKVAIETKMVMQLLAVAGYVAGALVLGTLATAGLLEVLPFDSPLLEKGAPKFARRMMMVGGLVLAPFFVVAFGTFAKGDHGWRPWEGYTLRRKAWRLLLAGLMLGVLSLGTIMLLSLVHGSREWNVAYATPKLCWKLGVEYPLKAVVVAIFEETLVRGYLLRGLCRGFGAWGAIVLASLLFAFLHFLNPAPESFYGSGIVNDTSRILVSGLTAIFREPDAVFTFINLFLMSAFLCLVTLRTGTIWPAAGVHAGWVWVRLSNSVVADSNPLEPTPWFFGQESSHLDALVTACVLFVLCFGVAHSWIKATKEVA